MELQGLKILLSKNRVFIEKMYINDDFFKVNMMTVVTMNEKKNNSNVYFSYLLKSDNMWHGMLGHVNYNYIQGLININLLPCIIFKKNNKCEVE